MKTLRSTTVLVLACLACGGSARAEVVEEIIAWVNGEIIMRSEYDEEQKARTAETYQQFSGDELDREVARLRRGLLLEMIDRKILVHHARAMGYDMTKMADAYLKGLMKSQKITDESEIERMAREDGLTLQDVKKRLLELYAPADIIDLEVANRISVSEAEIEAFYEENRAAFKVPGEVAFREIVLLAEDDARRAARREEALAVRQRALAGEDFATLAREISEAGTRDVGGKLGPLKRAELAPLLAEVVFTLRIGQVSELMETPYGFHVVVVESRIDEHFRPLDEGRDLIRKQLQDRKLAAELDTFMIKARGESEWCVAPKHHALLSIEPPPPCEVL